MKNLKRYLVVLCVSLFAIAAYSPVAIAATAPAAVQYDYDPVPKASDDGDSEASAAITNQNGTPGQFPLLMIGAIVLVVVGFGAKAYLDRHRRNESGGPIPRPTVPLALMGAILIGALAFGAGGTTAAPKPKAPSGFLNVAPQEGLTEADTARMAQGGVRSIKIPMSWEIVQSKGPDSFEWGLYDNAFRSAADHGITVLPVLYASPPWLGGRTTFLPKTKSQIKSWRQFVAAAVERYGSKGTFWNEPEQAYTPKVPAKSWQIWNEANFHYFAYPVSARNYGGLVNSASSVIRAKDPKAKVMLSGLFGRPKGKPKKAVHASKFIRQLRRFVKPGKFDYAALHPYTPNTRQLKAVVKEFRKAEIKAGYRKKPIVITEIGWGSGKATNAFLKGSPAKQARQLNSALSFLIRDRRKYRIKSLYWYSWKDTDPNGENCSFCYTTGLFHWVKPGPDGEVPLKPKPAWRSFVRLTGGFAG